jgi:hypothetical protein
LTAKDIYCRDRQQQGRGFNYPTTEVQRLAALVDVDQAAGTLAHHLAQASDPGQRVVTTFNSAL